MNLRRTVTVTAFSAEQYDGDWPPTNAEAGLAWFAAKVALVPEEFRAQAQLEIDATTRYDSAYAVINLTYTRPETDEELIARLHAEKARDQQRREAELQQLAALSRKYGKLDPSTEG